MNMNNEEDAEADAIAFLSLFNLGLFASMCSR